MALELLLLRHGETEWTLSGRHTSRTDLPLTGPGHAAAVALAPLLAPLRFARILSSPRRRARETAEAAELTGIEVDEDLREWEYGVYEGRTTPEILEERPGWSLWEDGCPGGEDAPAVASRCDRLLTRLAGIDGLVLVASHGHLLRVLVARWLGLPPEAGRLWVVAPGSLSRLGQERGERTLVGLNRERP